MSYNEVKIIKCIVMGFTAIIIGFCFKFYLTFLTSVKAMENGYEQVYENGQLDPLWKLKDEKSQEKN